MQKIILKDFLGSIIGLIIGLILISALITWWYFSNLEPLEPNSTQVSRVVIQKGATIDSVSQLLYDKELIHHPLAFKIAARSQELYKELKPGTYELSPGMSVAEIIQQLKSEVNDIWITIPEGLRVEEIAQLLSRQELANFDPELFIEIAKPSEGRLFPDTYLVPKFSSEEQLFDLFTSTFQQKIEQGLSEELANSKWTLEEVIIQASLVQREGLSPQEAPQDMAIIAGIIQNRLNLGMKLDIDATLSYLRGYDSSAKSWWSAPSPALKSQNSPYNTYLVAGLPPAPIANPGKDAILAVLQPNETSNLFYLHTPDRKAYYAKTYEEHQANINRYLR